MFEPGKRNAAEKLARETAQQAVILSKYNNYLTNWYNVCACWCNQLTSEMSGENVKVDD